MDQPDITDESTDTGGPRVERLAKRGLSRGKSRLLAILNCGLVSLTGVGCAQQNGVMEVDSGPPVRVSRDAGRVDIPVYAVHLGESLPMRFRAKVGTCDYAVLHDESAAWHSDCGAPLAGTFEWTHLVSADVPTGVPRLLVVSGYAQKGARDCMPIRGQLVAGGRPNDPPDWRIAEAAVMIEPYQSVLDTAVVVEGSRPDWALSRLVLRRSDGRQATVRVASGQGRGFTGTGPDDQGRWHVRYEPTFDEVNPAGETAAELIVADEDGRTTVFRVSFSTP